MPFINPVLLSEARTLAAYLIFLGSYFVFALGKFPWMKIDRPGAAIIGAVLMVAVGSGWPCEARSVTSHPNLTQRSYAREDPAKCRSDPVAAEATCRRVGTGRRPGSG
jgi:hypothetical protein